MNQSPTATEQPLAGRAGIVTGAGSGIGAAVARELADHGVRLTLVDLRADRLAATVASLPEGAEAVPAVADIRDYPAVERAAATCRERYGRIDVVVANAGVSDAGTLAGGDPAVWRAVVETNLLGAMHTVRATLPTLLAQGDGHVVLMASVSGRKVYAGEPVYIASKWGVVGLGEALRQETVGTGVRVTLVEPGLVDTPLARAHPFAGDWLGKIVPLQPEDVARAVVWALAQPLHLAVNEVVLRPAAQEI